MVACFCSFMFNFNKSFLVCVRPAPASGRPQTLGALVSRLDGFLATEIQRKYCSFHNVRSTQYFAA